MTVKQNLSALRAQQASQRAQPQLLELAQRYQIKTLYVQRNTSVKMAATVTKALGINQTFELEPLVEDWPANMLKIASLLAEGLN